VASAAVGGVWSGTEGRGAVKTVRDARDTPAGRTAKAKEEGAELPGVWSAYVDRHTEARLSRQRLLARVPMAELSFIVGEEALRNPVGDPEVMRGQWQRLLEVGALRNVEIQVMPAASGFHSGLDGPFVVLETMEHQHLGYIESQEVGCVVRDPAEVSAFGLRYGKLRSQALNGVESAQLIERLVGET
jgi:hypothetical protein